MDLTQKKCVPCEGGVPPIAGGEINKYLSQLQTGWNVEEGKKIKKEFKFTDFKESIDFVVRVAELAELEGHHPDIFIFYDRVTILLWTHAIQGLSENDFILAAKIEKLVGTKGQN